MANPKGEIWYWSLDGRGLVVNLLVVEAQKENGAASGINEAISGRKRRKQFTIDPTQHHQKRN